MSSEGLKEPNMIQAFRRDLAECWGAMPNKTLFFVLFGAWALLFHFLGNPTLGFIKSHSLFVWMSYVYRTSPDDDHCMFIPLVVLALFWWKRAELMRVSKNLWWPGVILVLLAVLLHLAGYMIQQTRVGIVAFFVGLYGLMGVVWGWRFLQASFFPYVLLVFAVPLGTMSDSLTFPLRMLVTHISVAISHVALGIDVIKDGSRIFDPNGTFSYDVAPACSGIRSLVTLLALTTIYGYMTFRTNWKRLLMVVVALPLAVVGNVIRITGVIIAAEAFGHQAGMKVHDGAGFITFLVALTCVMALGYFLKEDQESPTLPARV